MNKTFWAGAIIFLVSAIGFFINIVTNGSPDMFNIMGKMASLLGLAGFIIAIIGLVGEDTRLR